MNRAHAFELLHFAQARKRVMKATYEKSRQNRRLTMKRG